MDITETDRISIDTQNKMMMDIYSGISGFTTSASGSVSNIECVPYRSLTYVPYTALSEAELPYMNSDDPISIFGCNAYMDKATLATDYSRSIYLEFDVSPDVVNLGLGDHRTIQSKIKDVLLLIASAIDGKLVWDEPNNHEAIVGLQIPFNFVLNQSEQTPKSFGVNFSILTALTTESCRPSPPQNDVFGD